MQPSNMVPGLKAVVQGVRALSLSSSRTSTQHPMTELAQMLEAIPDYVANYKPFLGKPFLDFPDRHEETFTTESWKRITRSGKEQPGLCSFFQTQSDSLPSREVVMRERDFCVHFTAIKDSIDQSKKISDQTQQSFDYDDAALQIETLAQKSCSHLAGEELLMLLFCTYLVSGKSATSLLSMLIKIAPSFAHGTHLTLYESVYGQIAWFTHLCDLHSSTNSRNFSTSLRLCTSYINEHLLVKGQQGLFTQRIPLDDRAAAQWYHPIHFTHGISRFHDWYALCFGLCDLISNEMLIPALLDAVHKMPKTDASEMVTLLSMFSILDAILSKGISPNCWSILSQPDMSFEKWEQTKYFAFFCLKIFLYYPNYSFCRQKNTPLFATNILQGLSLFAPYCLHDHEHVLAESHFSSTPIFQKVNDRGKNPFVCLLDICYKTVAERHQKPFTLQELHAHTRAFVSHIPSKQYLEMSVEILRGMPELEKNLVYTLCVLSVLRAETVTFAMKPCMTIDQWKMSGSFLKFCHELLQSIQDTGLVARVLTILYQSGFDSTQFIQNLPVSSLQCCQNFFIHYIQNCHNSNTLFNFLHMLKQKDIDIDVLLATLSHDQFSHLSDTIEYEPTLFFPGILKNEDIPLLDLYNTFHRGLRRLVGVAVPLSFIERSLEGLTHISERCITKKFWYASFESHIHALFTTKWSFSPVHIYPTPLGYELYTQEDFKRKLTPLIENASALAPNRQPFIHAVCVEKIIDYLCILREKIISSKTKSTEVLNKLAHMYSHFYPIIRELLGACDPADAQKQAQRLSYEFFYPLVFPQEFSVSIVCETEATSPDAVEKKIDECTTLFINLLSSLAEPSSRQKHEDLVRKQVIECFIREIKVLAETPRKRKYDESACTERITAKNALMKLINKLFNYIHHKDVKRTCFAEIGKLKSEEHQISPQLSPRELLTEKDCSEHKHTFSIKSTGFRIIFEIAR